MLIDKNDYKVGDTLLVGFDGKILKHFKFDVGVNVFHPFSKYGSLVS